MADVVRFPGGHQRRFGHGGAGTGYLDQLSAQHLDGSRLRFNDVIRRVDARSQSGGGRVGGDRRSGVARRVFDDDPCPGCAGGRDRGGGRTVFERPGRGDALELQEESLVGHDWGGALAQRDRFTANRQVGAVAPEPTPGPDPRFSRLAHERIFWRAGSRNSFVSGKGSKLLTVPSRATRTLTGKPVLLSVTPYAVAARPSGSRKGAGCSFRLLQNLRTVSADSSPQSMATTSRPSARCARYSSRISGSSSRQGTHQVAQKLIRTGLPLSCESETRWPSMSVSVKAGA